MSTTPSRRSLLRWAAAAGAAGLAGCRARGLDLATGALPLASGSPGAAPGLASPGAGAAPVMPSAFVGHGSPMSMVDARAGEPWRRWGEALYATGGTPRAILVVSAHWEQFPFTLGTTKTEPLLYDFFGFPDELYAVRYPAPGAPALADQVERMLRPVFGVDREPERALDHGVFSPLVWLRPKADVPVLQLSIPSHDPKVLFAAGRALAPLRREGVLVLGSGNVTHNLRRLSRDAAPPAWAADFDAWTATALAAGDVDTLLDWERKAPAARTNHPTPDHWLPIYVVAGAADGARATFPVTGWEGGSISRRCVQFGPA